MQIYISMRGQQTHTQRPHQIYATPIPLPHIGNTGTHQNTSRSFLIDKSQIKYFLLIHHNSKFLTNTL